LSGSTASICMSSAMPIAGLLMFITVRIDVTPSYGFLPATPISCSKRLMIASASGIWALAGAATPRKSSATAARRTTRFISVSCVRVMH
jgi:hypothetical protein